MPGSSVVVRLQVKRGKPGDDVGFNGGDENIEGRLEEGTTIDEEAGPKEKEKGLEAKAEAAGEGRDDEAVLDLVDPGDKVAGRAYPGEGERKRAAGLIGRMVKEGAEEGRKDGEVEVTEPEEGVSRGLRQSGERKTRTSKGRGPKGGGHAGGRRTPKGLAAMRKEESVEGGGDLVREEGNAEGGGGLMREEGECRRWQRSRAGRRGTPKVTAVQEETREGD